MSQIPEREQAARQHHETKGQPIEMNFEFHEPSPTSTPSDHDNDPNKQTGNFNLNEKATSYQDQNQQSSSPNDPEGQQNNRAFSTYTFSKSSILDDEGRQVASMQGRYEDSLGRMKAVQERQIDGTKLRTTWSSMCEGQPETTCSSGSPEEFEAQWQHTPFGEAQKAIQEHQHQQQLERSG
ncbi:sporangia induced hypothetical protein [Phytophthora infestans T30-4]|uniref:Uncharacterized protein n=1 Tax=Phytophthora infestans (strain T30-4) TaxID=403677 RepID=D0NF45_PHYIT|nr:sporangia induced hypothetical protein [Phytophthora infestans T30-4]EEY56834.1 sporangia induced hypothetical protein [Phytophthora infestans T30-4]|eukprot:XP_002902162.1 sporangia induced hypothetical protein [Phytophthora infestans T30-4]